MAKKNIESTEADKEPVKHVLLECVPSQDGKEMYCKLVKPEDAKKILQKHAAPAVTSAVSSPTHKGKSEQRHIEPDTLTDKDSDINAKDVSTTDDCAESECEMFENAGDIASLADDQLIEEISDGDGEGGCEDDEF